MPSENGNGGAMLLPGQDSGTQVSLQDLFSIIGRKQVLLEVQAVQIEQLVQLNAALQREIAMLKRSSSIPNFGIDTGARKEENH